MRIPLLIAATQIVAGCSDPELSMLFAVREGAEPQAAELVIDVGGREFRLEPGERRTDSAPRDGELTVTLYLIDAEGDTIVETDFEKRFDDDDTHWVAGIVDVERPLGVCSSIVRVHPVPGTAADSLFVDHGRLPPDAIC